MPILDIQHILQNREVNFNCPLCHYTFEIPFQTYISDGSQVACPCCTKTSRIQHTDQNRDILKEILQLQLEL